jgi:MoaA/NifB/PqqE/SkfB family radical SAM enzyme
MKILYPELAGWRFNETDIAEAVTGTRLLNPSIDVGVACDLNCPYCFTEDRIGYRRSHRPGEMTEAESFAVLDDLAEAGAKTVNIVGAGEPLLHRLLQPVIEKLFQREIIPVVFTNGTRLAKDAALVRFLFERKATIILKLNSRLSDIQDAVAGRRGYTMTRDQALSRLLEAGFADTQPTRLGVDTLAFAGNFQELPQIHRWCRENNIYPLTSDFIPTGRTACGGLQPTGDAAGADILLTTVAERALVPLTAEERESLLVSLAIIDAEFGIAQKAVRAYYGGGPCTQILGLYVDAEGMIWPCVAKHRLFGPANEPLGFIRKGDKASKIWKESPYLAWIREHYTGACPYKSPLLRPAETGLSNLPILRDLA